MYIYTKENRGTRSYIRTLAHICSYTHTHTLQMVTVIQGDGSPLGTSKRSAKHRFAQTFSIHQTEEK